MPSRLDSIDAEIVKLLQEDGRMSSNEIARRLKNVTVRVVRYRIQRMIEDGIFRVRAIVNPPRLGFAITADVWMEIEASTVTELAQELSRLEQISYVSYSTGDRNVSLQVHARDMGELHHLVADVIGKMPGVRRTTTIIIPYTVKDIDQWEIPSSLVAS